MDENGNEAFKCESDGKLDRKTWEMTAGKMPETGKE